MSFEKFKVFKQELAPTEQITDEEIIDRILDSEGASIQNIGGTSIPKEIDPGKPIHPVHNEPRFPIAPGKEDPSIAPGKSYPPVTPKTM